MSHLDPKTKNIGALTGLRGIAALWVALYHFGAQRTWFHPFQEAGFLAILGHGYLAVDVFFVLSGFVMAISYGYFFDKFTFSQFGVFLTRRFARVYPLFAFVLSVDILVDFTRHTSKYSNSQLIANILLIQSWSVSDSVVTQSWSVSAEIMAYLLFPILLSITIKRGNLCSIVVVALSIFGLIVVALAPVPEGISKFGMLDVLSAQNLYPVLRCICGFCLGLFAYKMATRSSLSRIRTHNVLALAFLLVYLSSLSQRNLDLIFVVMSPIIIFFLSGRNCVSTLFALRPLVFLGEISYAVYFVHTWLLNPLKATFEPTPFTKPLIVTSEFIVYIFCLFSISYILHVLVEKPARISIRKAENVFNRRAEAMVQKSEASGTLDL